MPAAPARAAAVSDDCRAAASQGMTGTGIYTSDPALIARLVAHPTANAYVFFRLRFAMRTCSAVKYKLIVLDAANGRKVATQGRSGPGTYNFDADAYDLEFQVPIGDFDDEDSEEAAAKTSPTGTPSGVCVNDRVRLRGDVVHQGPATICATPTGNATWHGMFLQLNPGSGGGGEFDM
jgi:hypothetical protein